jgi:hypothetical protein
MNGKRVDAALELVRERRVNHAVAFESGLSPERLCYNIESEVRLAARPVAGMSLVQMRFVFHVQALWREGCNKLGRYDVLHSHGQVRSSRAVAGDNKTLGVLARQADLFAVKS